MERPASVVKELCENALDAGARRLEIAVEGGGAARIDVTDDGGGIPADDLPLAVARHATSKLRTAQDLERVATLGFRGEALAAIAAIADLEILTRTRDRPEGARLRVRGAQVVARGPAASAPGTTVVVRDLFFATPARLRFLRSPRTEATACVRVASELALCRPDLAVVCRTDGRVALRSLGGALADACVAVFGAPAAAELLVVDAPGDPAVGGLVSQPRAHRGLRGGVVLVVNGRRVHNRSLLVAVEEAYRGLLPSGRYPYGVVTVDLDPAEVDVNVHPTKREVRFRDDGRLFTAVQRAVWTALQRASVYAGGAAPGTGPPAEQLVADAVAVRWGGGGTGDPGGRRHQEGWLQPVAAGTPPPPAGGDAAGGVAALAPLRALGQAGSAWMVAESPRGVVLVDPHAAHEKVLYAALLAAHRRAAEADAPAPSQLLLVPVVVELEAASAAALEASAPELARMGLVVEPFGPGSVRVTAVPAPAAGRPVARLVHDVAEGLAAESGARGRADEHRTAALVACHAAVRLGEPLGGVEQQRLLDQLTTTPGGMTCPHGRPTVVLLEDAALRRSFGRPADGDSRG